jgi:hypothetical protein
MLEVGKNTFTLVILVFVLEGNILLPVPTKDHMIELGR